MNLSPASTPAARSWLITPDLRAIPLPHSPGLPHAQVLRLAQRRMAVMGRVVVMGGAELVGGIGGIQPTVLEAWQAYNKPFEGIEKFLYTDAIGLVTTGMGDLVDGSQSGSSSPWAPALALPWRNPDGSLASADDVIAAWQKVKAAWPGVQSTNCASLTTIRLDDAGVQQAVTTTLAADAKILSTYFSNWTTMPADAQLAILSMAWAMGAGFPKTFTQFTADINAGNYTAAAAQSGFQGVGVAKRIAADKLALNNAQVVVDQGLDPTALYWPNDASSGVASEPGAGSGIWGLLVGLGAVAGAVYVARRYGPEILEGIEAQLEPMRRRAVA
jgi:GH24 family phage-related lysozyme (muramidase)